MLITEIKERENHGPSGHMGFSTNSGTERDAANLVACEICRELFPSKRSLGMHWHHRHPKEANDKRLQESKGRARKVWSKGTMTSS